MAAADWRRYDRFLNIRFAHFVTDDHSIHQEEICVMSRVINPFHFELWAELCLQEWMR